jgi:dihydrodipicolinate synthase/N-acetylneuraminate lyase
VLSATDLRGLYAIIPTPARPDANRFDAKNTVDLDETARLVEALIRDGASGLITTGTTGECATLSSADFKAFVVCALDTVKRRIPTFVGATALGSHEVAARLDFVREQGADGTLLGLPMWQPVTTGMAIDYYRGASEYRPDLAIMVYANARAFRYNFPVEFWEGVAVKAKTVMSAKTSRPDDLIRKIEVTGKRINFVPIDMQVQDFHAISPATTTACWATAAAMGPQPCIAIMNAVQRNDRKAMDTIAAEIAWANEPILELIHKPEVFAQLNIQVEKIRIDAAGYCRPGPARSPYDEIPPNYAEASRECGRRWAQLREKLKGKSLAQGTAA